ncbi:hypothetical protein V8E54_008049 [Elaphomyces granulatus]|jgi:nucleolin
MAKDKTKAVKAVKVAKATSKVPEKALTKVKSASVTKLSQTPKAKSKEVARKFVSMKKSGGKKKPPSPSSSESESESDEEVEIDKASNSESESEDENQATKGSKNIATTSKNVKPVETDSESASEAASDTEEEKPTKAANGISSKKFESKFESESEAESESEESESEDEAESKASESEQEVPTKAKVPENIKKANVKKPTGDSSDEGSEQSASSEESASSDEGSDEEPESIAGSEDNEESSEESAEESEEPAKEAPKKRKAEEEKASAPKKSKTADAKATPGSSNLFVGNLSWNVDEDWLRSEFEGFGELAGVRIMVDRISGRSRGFGYVEFSNTKDAQKAFNAKKDAEIDGRKINLDFANPRSAGDEGTSKERSQARSRTFGDKTSPESDTLFIGNIAFGADEDAIRDLFADKGNIMGIRLPTKPDTGERKGYGYIQFSSVDEASQAFNDLQGAELAGRSMRLDFSTPRTNQGDSGRGSRGRGGGGPSWRGGRGGRGGGRGGRGAPRGGRGGSTNRGGFGDYSGRKTTFN